MPDYVFAKFGKKSDGNSKKKFIVTTDEATARDWSPITEQENETTEPVTDDGQASKEFSKIYLEIFETFIGFYEFVPLLLTVSSRYSNMVVETEILPVLKDNGEVISEDEDHILYRTAIGKYKEIKRSMKKIRTTKSVSPIIPRFYIMGLVSHFDYFIYQIAKSTIKLKPDIVFNKDSIINYVDLASFTDISEAKNHVVEKEIEKLLRDSHEEQLKWFASKLGMKIEPRKELFNNFIELCERRNLFAHTGGRISKSYADKAKKLGYRKEEIKIGEIIETDQKYFKNAVDTLIEMAFQLLAVIWNKIDATSGEEISKSLINITYNLILEEKYQLAIRLIEFVLDNKSIGMDQSTRSYHVINCANAVKLAGRNDYKKLLDTIDWSASTENFLICRSAILDEVDTVIELMPIVFKTEKMSANDFREWPIFKAMSKEKLFLDKFKELTGEPYLLEHSERRVGKATKEQSGGSEVIDLNSRIALKPRPRKKT